MTQNSTYMVRRKPASMADEESSWTMDLQYGGTLFAEADTTFRKVKEEDHQRHLDDRSPFVLA